MSELRLSVVIPMLEEAENIATAIHSALRASADEVLVADGGSRGTPRGNAPRRRERACCKRHAGAGRNSNAGAAAARGDVLWFVHADTRLSPRGGAAIRRALEDPRVAGGNFRIQFDPGPHDRFMTAFYYVIRHLRLFYGDSAIFCRRTAFEAAGEVGAPVPADPLIRKPHGAGPVASRGPAVGILTRASQAGRSRTRLAKALGGAAAELFGNGYTPVVLVGSDIPTLKRERVAEALTALRRADVDTLQDLHALRTRLRRGAGAPHTRATLTGAARSAAPVDGER